MKSFLIFVITVMTIAVCFAQNSQYPVPPDKPGQLFYLQHSRNKNTVVYRLNLKGDQPDGKKPIAAFWIRYSEKGQEEELNYVQRTFAYGVNAVAIENNVYELNLVSNKKYKMYLQQSEDGTYHVYTTINQRKAIIVYFFVSIIGGSALSPKVEYVEIFCKDAVTNKPLSERIKI